MCEKSEAFASACAVARAFSLYSRKSSASPAPRSVTVEFILVGNGDEPLAEEDATCFNSVAQAIQLAAFIVDSPCSEMNTDAFLDVSMLGPCLHRLHFRCSCTAPQLAFIAATAATEKIDIIQE